MGKANLQLDAAASSRTRSDLGSAKLESASYWPTEQWRISTPEEEGMDSAKLVEMIAHYEGKRSENEHILIDSVTIVRKGAMVADIYLNPMFPRDTMHVVHSCTKSIMSILIGIAIAEGYVEGVDAPVVDLIDHDMAASSRARSQTLTLKDLLTMQTGLRSRDSYLYQWQGLFEMQASDDWLQYILNLPMDVDPGTRFDYSNMSSFLLSAIIAASTGMDTLEFARTFLFEPLGIHDVRWDKSPQGIYIGWARMWLKPQDMAKIGLLYLHEGRWEDRQVVPAHWVKASTTAHSLPKKYRPVLDENGRRDLRKTIENWVATKFIRPFCDGYGFQWWLDKSGMYSAIGVGGQYITVAPRKRLVVVFTSKLSGIDSFLPAKLLEDYILPAVVDDEAIPANGQAQERLGMLAGPPDPSFDVMPVPPLPPIALEISGQSYSLDRNPWQYDHFQFAFDPANDFVGFSYCDEQGDRISYRVGLDNIPRMSETAGGVYAAVGSWTSPDTFSIEYERVGYSTRGKWSFTFEGNEIVVREAGVTGDYTYRGRMERTDTSTS